MFQSPVISDRPPVSNDRRLLLEQAVERLRGMIVAGELAPGSRLNERVLCEQLGISRTPLREAIRYLASEGLVELLPNRGAVVTALTLKSIEEIFAVLGALERLAGELACANATDAQIAEIRAVHYEMLACHARRDLAGYFRRNQEIHLKLAESTGNSVLAATYRQLNAHVRRARYMANLSRERWDKAVEEHEQMLEALTRRDAARLKSLLESHLGNKMLVVLESLRQPEAATAAEGA